LGQNLAMNLIPLIRVSILTGFVTLLEEIGAPVQRLLATTKLPASILHTPEALLPLKQVCEFYAQSAQVQECETLGLMAGQKVKIEELGAFGRLLYHSPTLHDAIQTAIHMIATFNSGDRIWLREQGNQIWLCHKFADQIEVGRQYADQYSIMLMIQLIQLASGYEWNPTEIHLETSKFQGLDQIAALSNTKVRFDQESTAVSFPRSLLSLSLKNRDEYPAAQRHKDYETLLSSAPATTFPGSIRQIATSLLKEGYPDVQSIAERLEISVRSLQRQLNEADLTYSRLIEQVRFDRSVQLLSDPTIKLADISAELGYTDAANFTRAFRRWTGVSPRDFRNLRHEKSI
jgi:AraC-like DNA-binding protein